MACFSVRICGNPGIICIANTAFQCPHCGKKYNDKDDKYINRISKIYINKVAIDFGIIKVTPFNGEFYYERRIEK